MDHLHDLVSANYPDQIDSIVYLVDGAGYHRSADTRAYFHRRRMHVILLAPYSYLVSVQEYVWAHLKRIDFNIDEIKTSQK